LVLSSSLDETSKPREPITLDQIVKGLFSCSNETLINLLNGIFKKNYDPNEAQATLGNTEFIKNLSSAIRADHFSEVTSRGTSKNYHIELQIAHEGDFAIRMFDYGLQKGLESMQSNTVIFPEQKVIYFERNNNIPGTHTLTLLFPNGQSLIYSVDVIKYWEISSEEMITNKMYPLLPLRLFSLRKELDLALNRNDRSTIDHYLSKIKVMIREVAQEIHDLYQTQKIPLQDYDKMVAALDNLTVYFDSNYFHNQKFVKEVKTMVTSLINHEWCNEQIEKQVEKQMEQNEFARAKAMKADGLPLDLIVKYTNLTAEEIEHL